MDSGLYPCLPYAKEAEHPDNRAWPPCPHTKDRGQDMAVQQNKVSKSRRNNRRAHDALVAGNPNECDNCGELKRPHHVCPSCGTYNDREIIAKADEIDLDEDAA
jgi:large subunit ribosomal protein L32